MVDEARRDPSACVEADLKQPAIELFPERQSGGWGG